MRIVQVALVPALAALVSCAVVGSPDPVARRPPACAVLAPVQAAEPTRSPLSPLHRDPLPTERWHRSPDGAVWALASAFEGLSAGRTKVIWIKPVGVRLEVTGRRLDGPAAPLEASLPEGYPGDFQASGLVFPTGGCWEVEARPTGGGPASTLRVVFAVQPPRSVPATPRPGG